MDYLFEYTVENPPVKGSKEYKLICQKAAEAMKDKMEAYAKRHTNRLIERTAAVTDGKILEQIKLEDEGPLLSEVIKKYVDYRDNLPKDDKTSWKPKRKHRTKKDNIAALKLFIEYIGVISKLVPSLFTFDIRFKPNYLF